MDISLERKSIDRYREIYKDILYCEISSDCVVSDTQDDIQRLLGADAQARLKSKDVSANSIHIGGEAAGSVMYLPESGEGIESVSFSIPFDCDAHSQELDGSCFCIVDMRVVALDVTVLNPRKIAIRAEIEVKLSCLKNEELGFSNKVSEECDKLFTKTASASFICPIFVGEKQLSLDEEFLLDEEANGVHLLDATCSYTVGSAERVGNKLIQKGRAVISAVVADGDGKIDEKKYETGFSQLFELPSEHELALTDAKILPSSEYYSIENGKLICDLHAVIEVICYTEAELSYISDAYYCGKQTEFEYKSTELLQSMVNNETEAKAVLHFDAQETLRQILLTRCRVGKSKLSDGKLSFALNVELLYETGDGDIRHTKLRDELSFNVSDECCDRKVKISDCNSDISENGIDFSVTALLISACTESTKLSMISAISIADAETEAKRPTLYICRKGERELWDIAKRYGSSEEMILAVNKTDDGELSSETPLLIPTI